jgi:hypothetical protein
MHIHQPGGPATPNSIASSAPATGFNQDSVHFIVVLVETNDCIDY